MTETIERKICDVCEREVRDFAGSLELKYSDHDYTGCGFSAGIKRKDICINCCRKLDKVVVEALKSLHVKETEE